MKSTIFTKRVYHSAPFTPYQFEDELSKDLEKDDSTILEERYKKVDFSDSSSPPAVPGQKSKSVKSQTQWTRALDVVQEHFCSHVILDGISHRIPPQIYALKHTAKRDWILYKKRECERRKRVRAKINHEKKNEENGKPSNILLAMVDSCEVCKKLYVTVNLFWGVTLCDGCYFNRDVINDIMDSKIDIADHKLQISSENIAEEVLRVSASSVKQPPKISPSLKPINNPYYQVPSPDRPVLSVVPPPSTSPLPPLKKRKKNTPLQSPPPLSPGEKHGNDFEKFEVVEAIVKHDDNPYFEEKSSTPSPVIAPSPHGPAVLTVDDEESPSTDLDETPNLFTPSGVYFDSQLASSFMNSQIDFFHSQTTSLSQILDDSENPWFD